MGTFNNQNSRILYFVLFAFMLNLTGCASINQKLKSFLNGKGSGNSAQRKEGGPPRFSEVDNLQVNSQRNYRRMTKEKFEQEAEIGPAQGSLWVMEGQGSYLFAQNQIRQIGDILNVNLEGGPKEQLKTKVKVITKLLERLDAPQVRGLASKGAATAAPAAADKKGAKPAAAPAQPAPTEQNANNDEEKEKKDSNFPVQAVPTRIVESLRDGSYRVKGSQPFMIGKREYRVIVTGIVRPEDYNDDGTNASKLLDAQFDIVSVKKGM